MTATRRPEPSGELARDLVSASTALATRFAAGASMWSWAPRWSDRARHLALAFAHPLIEGRRHLPAAAVLDPRPVPALRALVSSGDALVVMATADEALVAPTMTRAQAWGVETTWIGVGARPPPGVGDHVVWLDASDASALHTGEVVRVCHRLWDLTSRRLQAPLHGGGGRVARRHDACDDPTCVTCSAEVRLGEVEFGASGVTGARVRTPLGSESVDLTLVGDVCAGDVVVIQGRTAIVRVLDAEL